MARINPHVAAEVSTEGLKNCDASWADRSLIRIRLVKYHVIA